MAANPFDAFDNPAPPAAPPSAGAAAVPSGTDLIAKAKSQGGYVPSPDEAEKMSQGLAAIAARKGATATGPNPFDKFDNGPAGVTSLGSLAANAGAGANDAIAGTLGAPVDAATWALNKGIGGVNSIAGTNIPTITNPVGGSDSIKSAMGYIGADPRNVPVNNGAEGVARAAGSGAASMVLPYGGAKAIGTVASPALQAALDAFRSGTMTGNALVGAGAGAGGQIASDAVPEPWKPLANLGGNIVGGGLVSAGATGVDALSSALGNLRRNFMQPFGFGDKVDLGTDALGRPLTASAGQAQLAGNRLLGESSNPGALPDTLDEALDSAPLVPGSAPTTFQATGDQGLGQLERAQATKNPQLFQQRRADQNAARVAAVEGIAPAGSEAGSVGQFLTQRLADLDKGTDTQIQAARTRGAQAVQALGGDLNETQYGAGLRDALATAKMQAKANESALWKGIDPQGKLVIDTTPAREAANNIAAEIPQAAKQPMGEEAAILGRLRFGGTADKFSEFAALRGRLLDAIREERFANGETPALRRMQQLRQAMDDTISTGADRIAAQQAQAVQAGTLHPDETFVTKLLGDQRQWYADRDVESTALSSGPSSGSGAGPGANAGGRSAAVPGVDRAAGSAGGRFAQSEGVPSLSGEAPLTPNFDSEAAQRYRAAADATRNRAQTFSAGPVGNALRQGPGGLPYNLADSQVAARFFNGGSRGFEDAGAFVRAVGNRPDAVGLLHDYAASSLRNAAENADGTLNAAKYQRWMDSHEGALRAFPELAQRFQTAAEAQRSIGTATAARKDALDSFQTSAARHFLGDKDPADAVAAALRRPDRIAAMGELARMTSGNPAAREGLQRAVADYIQRDFIGIAGELKSDSFQTLWNKRSAALAKVFSPEQLDTIKRVAQDLDRAGQSLRTKMPGGPGTAQDVTAVARRAGASGEKEGGSLLTALVAMAVEHHTGSFVATIAGGLGVKLATAMRANGLKTVDDLVTEAMLNPALARTLLTKANEGNAAFAATALRTVMKNRMAAVGATSAMPTSRRSGE